MKKAKPKISVIIPTHDREHLLRRAVASVMSQTEQNFEILIINDSADIAKDIYANEKVRYIKNPRGGIRTQRNLGLNQARGEYIAYLDDDDFFFRNHLATLSHKLDSDKNIMIAYTDTLQITEDEFLRPIKTARILSQDFDYNRIAYMNYITTNSVMHRKSAIDVIGNFDEQLTSHEDWDLLIRFAIKYGHIEHIKEYTTAYTIRSSGKLSHDRKDFERTYNIIQRKYGIPRNENLYSQLFGTTRN